MLSMKTYFIGMGVIFTLLVFGANLHASELPRRASWQATFDPIDGVGKQVKTIEENSPFSTQGVLVGDQLLSVDGKLISANHEWYDITDNLVSNKKYTLKIRRGTQIILLDVEFAPRPVESYSNLDVEYGAIENDFGIRQRTITTLPRNRTAKLPAIFMLQGLSCSSIESFPGRTSNYIKMLVEMIRNTDMIVMRVEKPGMGDSQGNCSQTDFHQELNGYQRALETLIADTRVDQSRIIVYGNSMGSAIAPYLVTKYNLNGLISDGTFFRSWFEHMLEIERRIKKMQGLSEAQISEQMNNAYIPMYYGMLVQKKSYGELIKANPLLAKYNYHGPEHMYGRPMEYYHQVQEFDFAGAWEQVKAPVRIRWGQHDWIMSESDNHMIVDSLRSAGNSDVELTLYPKLDHWSTLHDSPANSFNGEKGQWDPKIASQIVGWAISLNARTRSE